MSAPRACALERGAPARLRSGCARLFPPLCFKLRAEPFIFIPLHRPPLFSSVISRRGRAAGAGVPLFPPPLRSGPLPSLCGGAWGRTGRGAEDRWRRRGGKPPACPERRPRPSSVSGRSGENLNCDT